MLITSGLSSVLLRGECKAGKVLRLNISDNKTRVNQNLDESGKPPNRK